VVQLATNGIAGSAAQSATLPSIAIAAAAATQPSGVRACPGAHGGVSPSPALHAASASASASAASSPRLSVPPAPEA